VGDIAAEANTALSAILTGIEQIATAIGETADISRSQAASMGELTARIGSIQDVTIAAATRAAEGAHGAARQSSSIEELTRASRELDRSAGRLRRVVSRFTVAPAEDTPTTPAPPADTSARAQSTV
jgi:methyl-accepting chemotaxis protein